MKQIIISVENDKYALLKTFIESLGYAKIVSEKEENTNRKKQKIINSITTGLKEVEQIEKGELKAISIKELLDEI